MVCRPRLDSDISRQNRCAADNCALRQEERNTRVSKTAISTACTSWQCHSAGFSAESFDGFKKTRMILLDSPAGYPISSTRVVVATQLSPLCAECFLLHWTTINIFGIHPHRCIWSKNTKSTKHYKHPPFTVSFCELLDSVA